MKKPSYRISTLDCGLTIITCTMPHLHSVSAGLFVRAGARFENKDEMGISHFVEHMLFKGSQQYTAQQISEEIEGCGGFYNAYTAEEHTCFYFKTLKSSFFNSLDVLIDLYSAPLFDSRDVEKERGVILEEINSYEDNPSQAIDDLFASIIWQGHPLAHMILGEPALVKKLTAERLHTYFNSHYTAPNTVLSVAGAISHEELLQYIKKQENRLRIGPSNHCEPFIITQKQLQIGKIEKPLEQCHMQLGMPCCGRNDSEQEAMQLFNTIVGENMSSRLFQEIREKRGLAYHISSSIEFYEEVGCFYFQCSLEPSRVDECIEESLKVIKSLTQVTPHELKRAKSFLIGCTLQDSEDSLATMLWLGECAIEQRDDLSFEGFFQRIEQVTQEQVEQLAEKLFKENQLNLAVIGPKQHFKVER